MADHRRHHRAVLPPGAAAPRPGEGEGRLADPPAGALCDDGCTTAEIPRSNVSVKPPTPPPKDGSAGLRGSGAVLGGCSERVSSSEYRLLSETPAAPASRPFRPPSRPLPSPPTATPPLQQQPQPAGLTAPGPAVRPTGPRPSPPPSNRTGSAAPSAAEEPAFVPDGSEHDNPVAEFAFTFSDPKAIFVPQWTIPAPADIKGVLYLSLTRPLLIRSIIVSYEAVAQWQFEGRNFEGGGLTTRVDHQVWPASPVPGDAVQGKQYGESLPAGRHSFWFTLVSKDDLAPTLRLTLGSVEHNLEAALTIASGERTAIELPFDLLRCLPPLEPNCVDPANSVKVYSGDWPGLLKYEARAKCFAYKDGDVVCDLTLERLAPDVEVSELVVTLKEHVEYIASVDYRRTEDNYPLRRQFTYHDPPVNEALPLRIVIPLRDKAQVDAQFSILSCTHFVEVVITAQTGRAQLKTCRAEWPVEIVARPSGSVAGPTVACDAVTQATARGYPASEKVHIDRPTYAYAKNDENHFVIPEQPRRPSATPHYTPNLTVPLTTTPYPLDNADRLSSLQLSADPRSRLDHSLHSVAMRVDATSSKVETGIPSRSVAVVDVPAPSAGVAVLHPPIQPQMQELYPSYSTYAPSHNVENGFLIQPEVIDVPPTFGGGAVRLPPAHPSVQELYPPYPSMYARLLPSLPALALSFLCFRADRDWTHSISTPAGAPYSKVETGVTSQPKLPQLVGGDVPHPPTQPQTQEPYPPYPSMPLPETFLRNAGIPAPPPQRRQPDGRVEFVYPAPHQPAAVASGKHDFSQPDRHHAESTPPHWPRPQQQPVATGEPVSPQVRNSWTGSVSPSAAPVSSSHIPPVRPPMAPSEILRASARTALTMQKGLLDAAKCGVAYDVWIALPGNIQQEYLEHVDSTGVSATEAASKWKGKGKAAVVPEYPRSSLPAEPPPPAPEGMDSSVWAALPEDIRQEYVENARKNDGVVVTVAKAPPTAPPPPPGVDPEGWYSLPEEIQSEILSELGRAEQQKRQRHTTDFQQPAGPPPGPRPGQPPRQQGARQQAASPQAHGSAHHPPAGANDRRRWGSADRGRHHQPHPPARQ